MKLLGEVVFQERVIFGPVNCTCGWQIYFGYSLWQGIGETRWREKDGQIHVCGDAVVSERYEHRCECGGDMSFSYHEQTVRHLGWVAGNVRIGMGGRESGDYAEGHR